MTSSSIQSETIVQNDKIYPQSTLEPKDYQAQAQEIRDLLIDCASKNFIHFASSLGTIELFIAITEVFDCLHDKVIMDGGHQSLPYKILTGRKDKMYVQGRKNGISFFPDPKESPYDPFSAGHVGMSVSAALGYSYHHPEYKSIAVVGDGAFTEGEIYEALNHAGQLQTNLLVVYNQNGWSVDVNTGFLDRGTTLKQFSESLGFEYIGAIDGHDTEELIEVLSQIKERKYPIFLHVKTVKGKGYKPAEKYPAVFHTPPTPFKKRSGSLDIKKMSPTTKIYGQIIKILEEKGAEYFQKYSNMYHVYPSIPILGNLKSEYPERVIDTGITEQHCMTFSTALAAAGNRVFMGIYAFFLPRCYDQVFDLCMQQIPLTINVLMSNLGEEGGTHQSIYIRGALKLIPGLTIMEPVTLLEYEQMLDFCVSYDKPVAILVPNTIIDDRSVEFPFQSQLNDIKTGQGIVLKSGDKLTVVPAGAFFPEALKLSEELEGVELIHPRFLKPFDWDLLLESVEKTGNLLVLEESLKISGVAADIAHYLLEKGVKCNFKTLAVDDQFIPYPIDGTIEAVKSDLKLDYEAVKQKAEVLLN